MASKSEFIVRLDPRDRATLEAAAAAERLTFAEIVRRAVRFYAADLGVATAGQPQRRRSSSKGKRRQ